MTIATGRSAGTDAVQAADTWVATKLRYLLEVNPATPVELRAQSDRLVPFIPMEALGEDGSLDTTRQRPVAELLSGYSYFANGDVLMAKVTPCFENGKAALVQSLAQKHGFGSTEITTLRANEGLDPLFLYYLVRSDHFRQASIASMTGAGGLKRVPDEHIRSFNASIPTESVQREIAEFLDRETAKIDALIDKQEQLIATLREDRAATITHAVTKGLDAGAASKESGSTWLGTIPADWTKCQLGRLCRSVSDGPHFSPDYVDEHDGVMFLSARNIRVDGWSLSDAKFISEEDYAEFSKRVVPEVGDVLYTKGGTTGVARAVDIEERFQVWVHVAVLKVRSELINPKFLAYALNSQPSYEQSQLYTRGATNKDLGLTRMIRIILALPPIPDQVQITEFLDERCSKIDSLIEKSTEMIEVLREYRSALITNAVTGKIDVREAV